MYKILKLIVACITSSDSDREWTFAQTTVLNKIEQINLIRISKMN